MLLNIKISYINTEDNKTSFYTLNGWQNKLITKEPKKKEIENTKKEKKETKKENKNS